MKRFLTFISIVIIIVAPAALFAQQHEQPILGQQAPLFELKAIDGKTYSLDQLKGRYVVIHFAATWCPFCNAEAPYLEELYRNYRSKNVLVFIVDEKKIRAW